MYVSHTIRNVHEEPIAYLRWQLMDVITVLSASGQALASLIMAESPTVVMGPYWVPTSQHPQHVAKGVRGNGLFEYK